MILPIVAFGDPVLRKKAEIIIPQSLDLSKLIADMFETMYHASGVGLAAPQIGKAIRLFVIDSEPMDTDSSGIKRAFINPEIIEESGKEWPYEEGCLSIPGLRGEVFRKPNIMLRYQNENFETIEEPFSGMVARVIQHEYDHLEGVLFTDYFSPLRKRLLKGKLADISKGQVKTDYRMRFAAANGR